MKPLNSNSRHLKNSKRRQRTGLIRYFKSIYKLPDINEKRYEDLIENVFEIDDFKRHLDEVKFKLNYDPNLIEDVIKTHIRNTAKEIIKIRPWKRTIFVHRWAKIEVFPLIYNPYSIYYDRKKTRELLKIHRKEFKILKNKQNE